MNEILLRADKNNIATLTLNRPAAMNALSEELLRELNRSLTEIAADKTVRVVVLAAAGDAFCTGHDLKQMRSNPSREYQHKLFTRCSEVMQQIVALPQPVIARVQGMAVAAGCQLVASCDLAVAVLDAKFAVSGVRVGLFCSTPAVALSRSISTKNAMQMLLTGEFIDAQTALRYGLINRAVAAAELDAAVVELAARIAAFPPRVIQLGKNKFYQQRAQSLSEAYATATDAMADNMLLAETAEGIDAFLGKRKPQWPRE